MEPEDQWCEQRMWRELNVDVKSEIICAVTGLAFLVVPYIKPPAEFTEAHVMFHVVFVFLGLGTIFYHLFPNFESNNQATVYELDWYPMVFTCATLLYIHLVPLNRFLSHFGLYVMWFLFVGWFSFLTLSVYHVSVEARNAVMVAVPVTVFFLYSVFVYGSESVGTWALLVISLVLWTLNKYLCHHQYWMATFHGIYHVLMAFALWGAGCLGLHIEKFYHK